MRIGLGIADVLWVADLCGKPLVVVVAALNRVAAKQDEWEDFALCVAIAAVVGGRRLSNVVTKVGHGGDVSLCIGGPLLNGLQNTQSCRVLNADIARLTDLDDGPLSVDALIDHLALEDALLLALVAGFIIEIVEGGSNGGEAQEGEDRGREELHDGFGLSWIGSGKLTVA